MGGLADLRVEPGLLAHLADQGVARVLTVVEATTGQVPLLVGRDLAGQAGEQDLVVPEDQGVRRDALQLRQGFGHDATSSSRDVPILSGERRPGVPGV